MPMEQMEFKFPHESKMSDEVEDGKKENKNEEIEVLTEGDDKLEVEVVDDTPEKDRGRTPMKEPPKELTDDELAQYGEKVQERIRHFSKGYNDERRAKEQAARERDEALRLAESVVEENKRLKGSLSQGQTALLEQAKKVSAAEVAEAERKYRAAYEAGDADALVAAQRELTSAQIKAERVNNFRPPAAQTPLQREKDGVQTEPPARQAPATVDPKLQGWMESNPWFGKDDEMTALAFAVHRKLVASGVDPKSDEYYDKVTARVKEVFPGAFTQENGTKPAVKKSTVVAPATRNAGTSPRKVVLTQTQVAMAKRLGVPLEAYAKQVAEMEKRNG